MENMRKYSSKFVGIGACLCSVAAILSCLPNYSHAAPVGGVVGSGSATISASGLVTTVNQSTDRAVIDWSSFNLAQNETARFVVPSDTSATLNRISGGLTTISGSVESNGVVYFSNPNGLVFDATSRVSANGFVATTGSISNFDFMSRGSFASLGNGSVTLNGAISAPAITAEAGTVTVGGNLSAGGGKILLSSSNLTTIGSGATISADGGLNNNG
ncbi:MAG: filamentous hemagglutinin N-terminal domain-containing protein, partial [Alphaproteobacteria bacterium]|nr:filamentous hemagglutinin N-terminal domain-containing protein [Alphaproteobacteria bacterium]